MRLRQKSSPFIWSLFIIVAFSLAACEGSQEDKSRKNANCIAPNLVQRTLQAGQFIMGSHPAYEEEGPPKLVAVAAFDIDATEVTNAQFARFVDATGYVTDAEKPQAGFGEAGGVVFRMPTPKNPSWWHFIAGKAVGRPIKGAVGPFPNIANHVIKREIIGPKAADRRALGITVGQIIVNRKTALPCIGHFCAVICALIAPNVDRLGTGGGGIFPFRLAWQAASNPCRIGFGVIM